MCSVKIESCNPLVAFWASAIVPCEQEVVSQSRAIPDERAKAMAATSIRATLSPHWWSDFAQSRDENGHNYLLMLETLPNAVTKAFTFTFY